MAGCACIGYAGCLYWCHQEFSKDVAKRACDELVCTEQANCSDGTVKTWYTQLSLFASSSRHMCFFLCITMLCSKIEMQLDSHKSAVAVSWCDQCRQRKHCRPTGNNACCAICIWTRVWTCGIQPPAAKSCARHCIWHHNVAHAAMRHDTLVHLCRQWYCMSSLELCHS